MTGAGCHVCGGTAPQRLFTKHGYRLDRCTACGLVWVANPPEPSTAAELYSFASGYHRLLGEPDSPPAQRQRRMAEDLYSRLRRYRRGGVLLDVGCSVGFFLRVALAEGWEVYGLEPSSDTSSIARERYGLNVVTSTLAEVVFADGSFDVVTLWDVLEHLEDPIGALGIVGRLLRPGGVVGISTPNIDGLFPRLSYHAARLIDYWPHPEPPYHRFQFSKRTLRAMLERTEFELLGIEDDRIPLQYTFGSWRALVRSPRALAYAAGFAPLAWVAPLLGSGDTMVAFARKRQPTGR